MIQLPYLSVLKFSGPDAGSFLHAQLSADILALEDGDSGFATYCTARGQVLGLLLLGRAEDSYFAIGSSELLPAMAQRLQMFVLRAQVQIEIPQGIEVCGLLPSDSTAIAGTLFSPANLSLRYSCGAENSDAEQDQGQWKFAELSQGVAWLDDQTAEKYIPQMLGFDSLGAVSFNKGCYPGQEIVARTRYLGKVKRTPLIITVEGECKIRNGSVLQVNYGAENVNGTLVDSAPAENGNTLLFIVTRKMNGEKPAAINYESTSFQVVL
jgi:folate-binding protein YgfZ